MRRGLRDGQRLYQLVRQNGTINDHTFEIQFLDPSVEAYAFTFGDPQRLREQPIRPHNKLTRDRHNKS
jgi:hypothetical protein